MAVGQCPNIQSIPYPNISNATRLLMKNAIRRCISNPWTILIPFGPSRPRPFSPGTENGTGCARAIRSEEHTSELQSRGHLVCRLLLEKKQAGGVHSWH